MKATFHRLIMVVRFPHLYRVVGQKGETNSSRGPTVWSTTIRLVKNLVRFYTSFFEIFLPFSKVLCAVLVILWCNIVICYGIKPINFKFTVTVVKKSISRPSLASSIPSATIANKQ